MAIGSSDIDFWEIKRYLTLALGSSATPDGNPIPLGDFVTGNSNRYLNPEQTIAGFGNFFSRLHTAYGHKPISRLGGS
jgi:hypothetical protein